MQLMKRGAFTHTHIISQRQKKFHTRKGSHAPIAKWLKASYDRISSVYGSFSISKMNYHHQMSPSVLGHKDGASHFVYTDFQAGKQQIALYIKIDSSPCA
jgi:hypothetical protein